jgi:hypothetical protein
MVSNMYHLADGKGRHVPEWPYSLQEEHCFYRMANTPPVEMLRAPRPVTPAAKIPAQPGAHPPPTEEPKQT